MTSEVYGRRCPLCIDDELHAYYLDCHKANLALREKQKKVDFDRRFASVQIGNRFQDKHWDDFVPPCPDAERVLSFCRKYADGFSAHRKTGAGLVFVGNPGTGKNMLSALIARDVVAAGFTALHTTAAKLIRRIRSTWGGGGDEEAALREFCSPDLLIIDEVGVQAGSESEERLLTEVINDRYESRSPVILISNLDLQALERYLGFRAMDRLCEDGRVLPFTWQSWRRKK